MKPRFRLLLIDDDAAIVRLLTSVIRRSFDGRIDLQAMTDPSAATDWIAENGPELVVTDLDMPEVDGLEILRATKRRNPYAQVLMLTGNSTTDALLQAMENGAADYLLKPVNQQELIGLLEQAHDRLNRWRVALHGTLHTSRSEA